MDKVGRPQVHMNWERGISILKVIAIVAVI